MDIIVCNPLYIPTTAYLKQGGVLIFEIGKGQEKIVERLFKKNNNYENHQFYNDGVDIRVNSTLKK